MSIIATSDILTFLGKANTATDQERALIQMIVPLAEDSLKNFLGYSVEQDTYTHFLPKTDNFHPDNDTYIDVVNSRVTFGGHSNSRILALPEIPVRTITSLYEDSAAYFGQGSGDFAAATQLTEGTDFVRVLTQSNFCPTGHIRRIGATWPARMGTIQVTYVAGYTVAELDGTATAGIRVQALKQAAIIAAAAAFKTAAIQGASDIDSGGGALAAESITTSGHSVTYDTRAASLVTGLLVDLPPAAKRLAQPYRRYS